MMLSVLLLSLIASPSDFHLPVGRSLIVPGGLKLSEMPFGGVLSDDGKVLFTSSSVPVRCIDVATGNELFTIFAGIFRHRETLAEVPYLRAIHDQADVIRDDLVNRGFFHSLRSDMRVLGAPNQNQVVVHLSTQFISYSEDQEAGQPPRIAAVYSFRTDAATPENNRRLARSPAGFPELGTGFVYVDEGRIGVQATSPDGKYTEGWLVQEGEWKSLGSRRSAEGERFSFDFNNMRVIRYVGGRAKAIHDFKTDQSSAIVEPSGANEWRIVTSGDAIQAHLLPIEEKEAAWFCSRDIGRSWKPVGPTKLLRGQGTERRY